MIDPVLWWQDVLPWHGDVINYGDVPTWLAFSGAAVAVIYARRALHIERERDSQAAVVITRVVEVTTDETEIATMNASDRMIAVLRFRYRDSASGEIVEAHVFDEENARRTEGNGWLSWPSLAPGESVTWFVPRLAEEGSAYAEFRDARSRRWRQYVDQQASEVKGKDVRR